MPQILKDLPLLILMMNVKIKREIFLKCLGLLGKTSTLVHIDLIKNTNFYFTEKTKIPEDVYVRIIGHCVGM